MVVKNLRLVNFRNYLTANFTFHPQLNLIVGENGSGKTTILEALQILALSKSFRSNVDADIVNNSESYYQVFGEFEGNSESEVTLNVNFSKNDGKKVFINKYPLKKRTDMVGKVPTVILSPDNQNITGGGPAGRRDFINRILSQIDREYFAQLIEYRVRLLQRNSILVAYRQKRKTNYDAYVETNDELLTKAGEYLQKSRYRFLEDFNPVFQSNFEQISHIQKPVSLKMQFNMNTEGADFGETFLRKLRDRFQKDIEVGRTTCGPHLDNLIILLGDKEIRQVGSQGEHKVVLVALKMAEGQFIQNRQPESVIFLLDDLFALLDEKHCLKIVDDISRKNQTFVTTTDAGLLKKYGFDESNPEMKIIHLSGEKS
ncbi:MAG: DNA replication and repair protein RecF [Candidatus Neomarinimicrobiota bacterium]